MFSKSFIIVCAVTIDFLLGDPRWLPHPVRAIGWTIGRLESGLRRFAPTPRTEKIAGLVLVLLIVSSVYCAAQGIILWSFRLSSYFGLVVYLLLAYTTLAARSLADAARGVLLRLNDQDIASARQELSMIVGRDTAKLDSRDICRAVVETVAENTSDGIIAPLAYLAIGGPALALAYKAVNTLDSMIGYKNERYLNFGWAAARMDDAANYIPARISAFMICLAADILRILKKYALPYVGYRTLNVDLGSAWRIMFRDGRNHPSPNSGYPEAAFAGALGIRLGGPSTYAGKLSWKPHIGTARTSISKKHIEMSVWLMYSSSLLAVFAAAMLSL
jgi:adenosylcobinamide-phosphate synthase